MCVRQSSSSVDADDIEILSASSSQQPQSKWPKSRFHTYFIRNENSHRTRAVCEVERERKKSKNFLWRADQAPKSSSSLMCSWMWCGIISWVALAGERRRKIFTFQSTKNPQARRSAAMITQFLFFISLIGNACIIVWGGYQDILWKISTKQLLQSRAGAATPTRSWAMDLADVRSALL